MKKQNSSKKTSTQNNGKYFLTIKPLELNDFKWKLPLDKLNFKTTRSLKAIEKIIGQERAMNSLKIGAELWAPGYNIFIAGLSGTGKLTTVKKVLETLRPKKVELKDYAYVNNFDNSDQPTLLTFQKGYANKFKKDMTALINYLQKKIPQALDSQSHVERRKSIISEYTVEEQNLMGGFEDKIRKDNFSIAQINVGEITRPDLIPIIDNQPVMMQHLDEMVISGKVSKENAENIKKKYVLYAEELQKVFKKGLQLTQIYNEKISYLEKETVSFIISGAVENLKEKYKGKKFTAYFNDVERSILENLDIFKGIKIGSSKGEEGQMEDYFKNYEVNVILDNSKVNHAPIIIETTPSYNNIFGNIEKVYDNKGGWYADFTKIKAGSLLKANNGYLVINASDAFQEHGVWKALKRAMLYGVLEIQDSYGQFQFTSASLKPEAIEINTKIIFIGAEYLYSTLSYYEDDFEKIFKVKADFDYEINRTDDSVREYIGVIKYLIDKEKLRQFDKAAVSRLLEYSARYTGEKNKLTRKFSFILDLMREANFWASKQKSKTVLEKHIIEAYIAAKERHGLAETKLRELILDKTIIIDTEGEKTGQVNGLAVYGSGIFSFGKPTRITAAVSLGSGNIINVERESGLSGNVHNKGVLIISGYFREKFGQKTPLAFNASLVFEQGYGVIDGDSASAAEICALLSCLSNIPIKQHFAVTGSINQKGDIQPIGGVNEKIEGFFDICKKRGLNKRHGVIIPAQNVKDLMLKDEIIDEAAKGNFKIFAVSKIEEAIEILTGKPAGKLEKNGEFTKDSIYCLVEKKLKEMNQIVKGRVKRKIALNSKTRKTKLK